MSAASSAPVTSATPSPPARRSRCSYAVRLAGPGPRAAQKAVAAGERERPATAADAQAIVIELLSSLQVDAWEGGPRLAALYNWLLSELVQANMKLDTNRISSCRQVVEPLRDAWRQGRCVPGRRPRPDVDRPGVPCTAVRQGSVRGGQPSATPTGGRTAAVLRLDAGPPRVEGEVLAAEETLARGRAEEIAAWGRRPTTGCPRWVSGRARRPARGGLRCCSTSSPWPRP